MSRQICCLMILTALCACGGSSGGGSNGDSGGGGTAVTGLDTRPQNLTCSAPDRTGGSADIALEPAFPSLPTFSSSPLSLLQAPGDASRWFAAEREGTVRVFANTPGVSSFDTDFVSISVNTSSEGGLLGMAFDPNFASNGRVYLSWTEGVPMQSVVGRFTSIDGGQTLPPTYDEIIRIDQDFDNHNGGQIAFGNDGYLYFGVGDGGSGNDPNERAQDTTNLLGAMLRLDVSGTGPGYAIPPDNPFAGNAICLADHSSANNCPEIYAWGLRNPWRWSFDVPTGELWLGDVGQDAREEINVIELGGNYGWDCREGLIANSTDPSPVCGTAAPFIEPVHDYPHSQGVSVTGGYVYRGTAIPALTGQYIFGDFLSSRIWRLVADGLGGFTAEELYVHFGVILSFAQGNDGELYLLDDGIQRIVAGSGGGSGGGSPVADQLSATGCFNVQDPAQPAPGMIPYDVNAPFWSDGAKKERWLAIPERTTISVGADGDFSFPNGTVLAKHFRLGGELIETRLFMRHPDGGWAGYTYEWNGAGTDADLVTGGKVVQINGQDWIYPSEAECAICHTSAAGFSLGLEVAQLNSDFTYAATGRTHNQLETLDDIGMFTAPLGDPSVLPAFPHPQDSTATLDDRARAYLHTNCAQCHRDGGPTPTNLDLHAATLLSNTNACGLAPQSGNLGITSPLIVAPGEPARSVLLARVNRRDANAMPPLASNVIDSDGVALLDSWITALNPACQ